MIYPVYSRSRSFPRKLSMIGGDLYRFTSYPKESRCVGLWDAKSPTAVVKVFFGPWYIFTYTPVAGCKYWVMGILSHIDGNHTMQSTIDLQLLSYHSDNSNSLSSNTFLPIKIKWNFLELSKKSWFQKHMTTELQPILPQRKNNTPFQK